MAESVELKPVAWRYRYDAPGRKVHWTLTQKPMASKPASPGWCAIIAEPLYAHPPVAAPDGWVLVPREPTEAMLDGEARDILLHWKMGSPGFKLPKAEILARIYRAMVSAAPSEGGERGPASGSGQAEPGLPAANRDAAPSAPEPDELTEVEIEHRAKALIRRSGWRPGDKLSGWSVLRLMVALGLDLTRTPATDRCGYPDCGCDFDAVCDAALPTPTSQEAGHE